MLLAFHGSQEVKEKYLSRVRAHIAADEVIHGTYWEKGKGCAVGCTIHSGNHKAYEKELGIPMILARLEDGIFESLENGRAKKWPEQFLSFIPVGADLSLIWSQFAVWLLTDEKWGVIQFAKTPASKKAIQDVSDAYSKVVAGSKEEIDWQGLRAAACAAAYAAEADSTAAAEAAAYAAAYKSKRQAMRVAQAEKLLELMAAAPVPVQV
jgi:hypothetical protein